MQSTIQLLFWLRIIVALSSLSIGVRSLDSLNLDLEILNRVDVSALGTPNLDRYNGTYNLTVEFVENDTDADADADADNSNKKTSSSSCRYTLQIDFNITDSLENDIPGESNFEGNCAPNNSTGNSPSDNLPWHEPRRNWIKFPDYVFETTGFNHISINWVPCGSAPGGLKKARYDLNFYTVIPQYRTFMTCDEFKTPSVCQYNQSNHQGRSQFSMPRLVNDPNFLANMPLRFQPDPEFPEAFQYEGLTHFDRENIPKTAEDWRLPTFLMSTYDAAVVSWRAMIPYSFVNEKETAVSSQSQFYVYHTMLGLPSEWNMSFDRSTGIVSVYLHGSSTGDICGSKFDQVKAEQEYGIVFEDRGDTNNVNNGNSNPNLT